MKTLGKHLILEFYQCGPAINNAKKLGFHLKKLVKEANGHILKVYFHKFQPQGVSGIVLIAESHVSIHTWPEYDFAAADVFTCSKKMKLNFLVRELKKILEAKKMILVKLDRGVLIDF